MTTGPNTPDQPHEQQGQQGQQSTPPGYGTQPPYGQQSMPPQQMPPHQMPPPNVPLQQQPMRPDEEKLWAVGAHLGPILLGFIAPLVVWLVFKERSAFLDRHGKEALNMQISYMIYFLVAGISLILLVGFVLLPVVGIAWLVLMIVASVKAANFEDYRYPLIFRFIG
jgi:uncharacterized Tic20 family protein